MNPNNLLLSALLVLLFGLMSCASEDEIDVLGDQAYLDVIYVQNICCENLQSLEAVAAPNDCGLPHHYLFATNMEVFEIPNLFSFGDTLSIQFQFKEDCEAQSDLYDCSITCDRRHGIPIEITAIY